MGFAKYCEDNTRLTEERNYYREHASDLEWHRVTKNNNRKKTRISVNHATVATFINRTYRKLELEKAIQQNDVKNTKNGREDKYVMCKDCGQTFVFSAGEQKFFAKNGWTAPVRCKDCREEKAILRAMRGWK